MSSWHSWLCGNIWKLYFMFVTLSSFLSWMYQNWGKNVCATPRTLYRRHPSETQRGSLCTTCGTGVTVSGKVASLWVNTLTHLQLACSPPLPWSRSYVCNKASLSPCWNKFLPGRVLVWYATASSARPCDTASDKLTCVCIEITNKYKWVTQSFCYWLKALNDMTKGRPPQEKLLVYYVILQFWQNY